MTAYFSHIIGNEHIKSYLTRMVEKNAVANSLLFAGPEGIGKSLFAEAFAKLLLCSNDPEGIHLHKIESGSHPDVRVYHPEGKIGMHSIDSMRQFSEEVYLAPYEGLWKVFIIHNADRMLTYSANALLKTFEEPAPRSIIILLSSTPEALLPTVLSRCRTIRFHLLPEQEIARIVQTKWQKSKEEASIIAGMSGGSIGNADRLTIQGGDPIRVRLLQVLSQGKMSSYSQLMEIASEIGNLLDLRKQEVETLTRAELLKAYPKDITSVQQQTIDKEVDGMVSMQLVNDAQALLNVILGWYRDMHLLSVGGNSSLLMHPDFKAAIVDSHQQGHALPLELVQKAIAQTKLALARSTPISNCLENLFLSLNLF